MTSVRSVSIRVKGRVQGVWFRASAKAVAERLHLTGFVSNARDGSVYIEASGSMEAIDDFISWCRRGPELARVETLEISDIEPQMISSFEIRRH